MNYPNEALLIIDVIKNLPDPNNPRSDEECLEILRYTIKMIEDNRKSISDRGGQQDGISRGLRSDHEFITVKRLHDFRPVIVMRVVRSGN